MYTSLSATHLTVTRKANHLTAEEKIVTAKKQQATTTSVTGVSVGPWPSATTKTLQKWSKAHPAFHLASESYLRTQRRMLFLHDIPEKRRWPRFLDETKRRHLSNTTAESYWTAYLATKGPMGAAQNDADKKALKWLGKQAAQTITATPVPMTAENVAQVMRLETDPRLALAIALAWSLGQRISDVAQLRKADITMHGDVLAITVRKGKVVPIIGPYVLSMASSHPLAMPLWSQCQKPGCHLFLEEDSDEQRAAFAKRVQRALSLLNCGLEARSIRRGGLQSMAAMNWPLDRILQFSQHRSEQMLLRYLDYGRAASHRTTQLVTVAFTMGEALSVAMEATNSNPTTFSELSKAPTPRRNSA